MKENIKELIDKYQVRKTYSQKSKFINWIKVKSSELGYELKVDNYSKKGRNLIVGDVENSSVILTAHYDTQPNFFIPMFMGVSWLGFVLGQLYLIIMILLPVEIFIFIYSRLTGERINVFLLLGIIFFILIYSMIGVANKHTVNDNTSGVVTLLTIMEDLKEEERGKVCFVFFDQEELGLIGSSRFSNKYKTVIKNKPLINFDCISNGNNLAFIGKKAFIDSKYSNLLSSSIVKVIGNNNEGKNYLIEKAVRYIYPSDQLNFKNSVGVAALKKAPVIGYYLNAIHNSRDKVFMEENIDLLKETMIDFIEKI